MKNYKNYLARINAITIITTQAFGCQGVIDFATNYASQARSKVAFTVALKIFDQL